MTWQSFLRTFLYSQLFVTPPKVTHDFTGQTIIVTGANVGLGLEAARKFAELGSAKLILAVRTLSKGEAAKESIIKTSGRTEDFVEVWPLDLTSKDSVRDFASRVNDLERLDVLVENAGIALTHWDEFEGMEQNTKVNVISTFSLALLVLPKLRQTAISHNVTPHLEIVTSEGYKVTTFPESQEGDIFARLADRAHYEKDGVSNAGRYPITKLMQILFVSELVKHASHVPVITLVTPGLTHSELASRSPSMIEHIGGQVFKFLLARKTEVGARALIAGACIGPVGHGKYMEDGKITELDIWLPRDQQDAVQRKTYEQTLAYLEKLEPGISKNI